MLRVEPHGRFRREGSTVHGEVLVSFPQAVLGAELEVETIHGNATLEVPAGTQPGREFRLRGQGIPRLDGHGKGDHVVRVGVEVPDPRELSDEEIALLRQLAGLSGRPVKEEGILDRMKDRVKKNLFGG